MDRVVVVLALVIAVGTAVALFRARRDTAITCVEPADFGLSADFGLGTEGKAVAGFTSPMCHSCQEWQMQLEREGVPATFVDVKARPELARRYGVRRTPVVLLVETPSGRVLREFGDDPQPEQVAELRVALTGS